jgi:hypothetical protein
MKFILRPRCLSLLAVLCGLLLGMQATAAEFSFRTQEIFNQLSVGYAVRLVDVNEDNRPDIVVVDTQRVVWFENPSWRMHTLIEHATKADNVSIAGADIDGDGHLDFALAADWRPSDTHASGTLQWISRGKSLNEPWTVHPIGAEPTAHRIRFADLDGDGREELIVVPLFGRDTKAPDYASAAVNILSYRIPADPRAEWKPEVINADLHVAHNFLPVDFDGRGKLDVLVASFEGVSLLRREEGGKWSRKLVGSGNQETKPSRGASEIKLGKLADKSQFLATIEPWHGFQVVVYRPPAPPAPGAEQSLWQRTVIDENLKWGHAVWCADLDGDSDEELIIGVRDNKDTANPCGVRIYDPAGAQPADWKAERLDPGGVAVEDLAAGDLDGDGKIDLVAVGRQTKNVRIYWNQTAAAAEHKQALHSDFPTDTLLDIAGNKRSLVDLRGRVATVLVCWSVECPISNEYIPTLNRLAERYAPRGIQLIAVDPNAGETLEAMRAHAQEQRLALPFLADEGGKVARRLRFEVTPEVRVFDAEGALVYRGRIDDRYRSGSGGKPSIADLEQVFDALLAGKPIAQSRTKPVGCPVQVK